MARDCVHGSLARSCEVCELTAEVDRLRARLALRDLQSEVVAELRQIRVERDRLRDGIATKAGWWDANGPDRYAFEAVDDFRRLLDGQEDDRAI